MRPGSNCSRKATASNRTTPCFSSAPPNLHNPQAASLLSLELGELAINAIRRSAHQASNQGASGTTTQHGNRPPGPCSYCGGKQRRNSSQCPTYGKTCDHCGKPITSQRCAKSKRESEPSTSSAFPNSQSNTIEHVTVSSLPLPTSTGSQLRLCLTLGHSWTRFLFSSIVIFSDLSTYNPAVQLK